MSLDAQRSWMYSGWKDNGRHSDEWIRNTNAFVNHVFEGVRSFKFGVSCPCSKCCNGSRRTKQLMTSHLCHWGFMPNYFRWIALFFCIYYLLCRHWKDIPVVRKGRRPASVLTCLLKSNHPGILDYDGVKVIATEWEHNHAVKDTNGHSVAEKIEDVFWLRYKYEDAYLEKAKQHVRRCCKSLLPSIFYYARIQAIIDHFRKTENTSMNDKLAGQYYLDRAQYLAQRQGWLGKEAWIIVVDEWCSEEKSKKYRANHFSSKFKPHKGGSNSMTTISQKMSEETGEEVNQIQAWVHTHRGVDKSTPLILNTPEATKCLVISEVRATGTSSAALKRRRAEEIEDVRRKESEKTKKAEAYANNLLSWGVGMYEHCNGIHKFLQTLATNQGVPIGETAGSTSFSFTFSSWISTMIYYPNYRK